MGQSFLLKGNTWTQMMSTELNSVAAATAVLQATGTNAALTMAQISFGMAQTTEERNKVRLD